MAKQRTKAQQPMGGAWSPEGKLRIGLNGYTITGAKVAGRWQFVCKDFPEIQALNGRKNLGRAMAMFFAMALRGEQ